MKRPRDQNQLSIIGKKGAGSIIYIQLGKILAVKFRGYRLNS